MLADLMALGKIYRLRVPFVGIATSFFYYAVSAWLQIRNCSSYAGVVNRRTSTPPGNS